MRSLTASIVLVTRFIFRLVVKFSFHSFSRVRRKRVRMVAVLLSRRLLHDAFEKSDVFSVTPTPITQQKMNAKPQPLQNGKMPMQRLGLEAAGLFAAGRQGQQGFAKGVRRA